MNSSTTKPLCQDETVVSNSPARAFVHAVIWTFLLLVVLSLVGGLSIASFSIIGPINLKIPVLGIQVYVWMMCVVSIIAGALRALDVYISPDLDHLGD